MAISLSSAAIDFSVLRSPWPGNRHAALRRGSHERKIVAGYAKSAHLIIGKSCATRKPHEKDDAVSLLNLSDWAEKRDSDLSSDLSEKHDEYLWENLIRENNTDLNNFSTIPKIDRITAKSAGYRSI
jgi:hypothetical protein